VVGGDRGKSLVLGVGGYHRSHATKTIVGEEQKKGGGDWWGRQFLFTSKGRTSFRGTAFRTKVGRERRVFENKRENTEAPNLQNACAL